MAVAEDELLNRLRSGEVEAVGEAYQRYRHMVYSVCRRILYGDEIALDALQETFLLLQRKAPELSANVILSSWLYQTGVHVSRGMLRAKARRSRREQTVAATAAASAPEEDVWEQVAPHLDRELAALPEWQRGPIVLTCLEGLSVQEAAGKLNIPEGTVRSRVARGIEALRRRLAPLSGVSVIVLTEMLARRGCEFLAPKGCSSALLEAVRQRAPLVKSAARARLLAPVSRVAALALIAAAASFAAYQYWPTAAVARQRTMPPVAAPGARTFYVSAAGSDANDGLSAEHPWKSLAKVSAAAFLPGDQILFHCGDEWRERIDVSSSGEDSRPVVYASYGAGAKPVFWGSDVLDKKKFQVESARVFTYSISQKVGAVLADHTAWFTESANTGDPSDHFEWRDGVLRLFSSSDPRTDAHTYSACVRENIIRCEFKSHVVIKDLAVDESASGEGCGIQVRFGSNVSVESCELRRAGAHHLAAINTDRFTSHNLHAEYLRPSPEIGNFFLVFSDSSRKEDTSQWIGCTGDHFENPGHRMHQVFSSAGPGLGVIRIEGLVTHGGGIFLAHDLSPQWDVSAKGYPVRYCGGAIENAAIEIFCSHILMDGVTFRGNNGSLDVYGGDNVFQNLTFDNVRPKDGGANGYSTSIVCRPSARRNVFRYCTVSLADDSDGGVSCLALAGGGTLTQLYGNIFITSKLAYRFEGLPGPGDFPMSDYNVFALNPAFTNQRLSFAQWQKSFDAHSLMAPSTSTENRTETIAAAFRLLRGMEIPSRLRPPQGGADSCQKTESHSPD
jgi:RNA polymerase sigma-70 factor (ECF subfamily)